jgi:hypothetical protein
MSGAAGIPTIHGGEEVNVPYLNPDPPPGVPDGWRMPHLVGWSLATTRPFAALGPLLSFAAIGRRAWASWSTAPWSWPPWPPTRSRLSRGCAWPPGRRWGRCCSAVSPRPTSRCGRTG